MNIITDHLKMRVDYHLFFSHVEEGWHFPVESITQDSKQRLDSSRYLGWTDSCSPRTGLVSIIHFMHAANGISEPTKIDVYLVLHCYND